MNDAEDTVRIWGRIARLLRDPMLLVDGDGRILNANTRAAQLLGREKAALAGMTLSELFEDAHAKIDDLLDRWRRSTSMSQGRLSMAGSDSGRQVRVAGGRLSAADESRILLMVKLADHRDATQSFSELSRQIERLTIEVLRRERAERNLDAQLRIFERLARGGSLEETLTEIVRLAERQLPEARCSILLLDDENRLRHGAAPSLPGAYTEAIDGVDIGPAVGSCGTAAYLAQPVIVENIGMDPLWADYRDLAAEHGLAACWSYPIFSVGQEVLGSVAMYFDQPRAPDPAHRDMTETVRYLAGIAIERARAEEALKQRALELVEADRRKNDFLAMLAHELRNPLAALVTTLELVRPPVDAERLEKGIGVLNRQSRHLTRIVDDLLDVARITRDKIDLQIMPVNLVNLLHHAHRVFRKQADEKHIEFALRVPDEGKEGDGFWVEGDEDRLLQVLSNLVSNAIKYTPMGGHVVVSLAREDDEAVVRVTDDGEGIEPSVLDTMFELFAQGRRSLDRHKGGLGIGLTLAKTLIERHEGTLEATSEGPGTGSEFVIRLPTIDAPTIDPEAICDSKSLHEKSGMESRGPMRILLVEDNQDSAEAMETLLDLWGYECRVVPDGITALNTAIEFEPDIVLLDIGLPGMDGYEVASRLRAHEQFAPGRCALIALTGYGQDADRRKSLDAGFDQHIIKPINPAQLHHLLNDFRS